MIETVNDQNALILATSSAYRRSLLERLAVPFGCDAPEIDESRLRGESARSMASRLARIKGEAVAPRWPRSAILSSDQTAALGDSVLGKPGDRETALAQLRRCSGQRVDFYTAVALTVNGTLLSESVVHTEVRFRNLPEEELVHYVDIDAPFDCAGSFRWEGLGICLFEHLRSDDPTALEGLPLISVAAMLRSAGINPLQPSPSA